MTLRLLFDYMVASGAALLIDCMVSPWGDVEIHRCSGLEAYLIAEGARTWYRD